MKKQSCAVVLSLALAFLMLPGYPAMRNWTQAPVEPLDALQGVLR